MSYEPVREVFEDGILHVDNSMLRTFGICQRKAQLQYVRGLQPIREPDALMFGTAIHAALDAYYEGKPEDECIAIFVATATQEQSDLALEIEGEGTGNVRSVERGIIVLKKYFIERPRDQEKWKVIATEVGFAIQLCEIYPIIFKGRIDLLVEDENGGLMVIDHKTTKTLGRSYFDQLRPNDALTGYCYAVTQQLKRPVERACLNVIQFSKEKIEFARGMTHRSQLDFDEWKARATRRAVEIYKRICEVEGFDKSDGSCHSYGGCQFRELCSIPDGEKSRASREAIEKSLFKVQPWTPYE